MVKREPAVCGQFYPSNPDKLKKMISGYVRSENEKKTVLGLISPHAGYIYSGHVAGAVFSGINIPDDVVLLGPNHTGMGEKVALMPDGVWETPLGDVEVNQELAKCLLTGSSKLRKDYMAHTREHSLEVQLPFLQYLNPSVRIVPITLMHGSYGDLKNIGIAVAEGIREYKKTVLIVVSSDMSHYVSHDWARQNDKRAIDKVIELDGKGLIEVCEKYDITMCGVYPSVAGIEACKELGAQKGQLVKYATSGEVSGDYGHVVGYAGITIN